MKKKLYRSRKDRVIGGVCGGIADYFSIDPTIVRLAFLLILLARGAGLIAYIIAWIIVPEKPAGFEDGAGGTGDGEVVDIESGNENDNSKKSVTDNQKVFGIILLILGGIFLMDIWIPHFYWRRFWPVVIIALGAGILIRGAGRNE